MNSYGVEQFVDDIQQPSNISLNPYGRGPIKGQKTSQIQYIIEKTLKQTEDDGVVNNINTSSGQCNVHLLRSVFIAIDLTQSMSIRDMKPSRLTITLDILRKMIRGMKDKTPICKFLIAKVENQLCKPLSNFIYNQEKLIEILDTIKVSSNAGFFSLENTLSVALDYFESIPSTFQKELLIIQSSPFTKDYKDIYQTINIFKDAGITLNIVSLVGQTFICQKLAEACRGSYVTVSNAKEFEEFLMNIAKNPPFDHSKVIKKLVRMSLGRRQYAPQNAKKMCYCHYEHVQEYFVCGMCGAILCQRMPTQCSICMAILVFPSDLYRHKN